MIRKARTMKRRLMRESKLGAEYVWNVISTCDQNGLQAIADEEEAHILIYDPNGRVWATQDTMSMADADIWELVDSKRGDGVLWRQTMMPAKGEKWEQFKAEWNALCNVKNEYPYQKTPRTDPIADEVAESRKRRTSSDQGMNELVVDWYKEAFPTDTDMFEDMEEAGSTFADVWDALDNGENVYDVIGADDSIVRERVFDHLAELTGKDYDVIYNMWLGAAYDYVEENRKMKLGSVSESRDFDEELLNPCPKCGGEAKFEIVDDFPWVGGQIECADCGHHVYEILSGPDETRSRDEMMDILIDMWNNGKGKRTFDEDIDNPNDWSALD